MSNWMLHMKKIFLLVVLVTTTYSFSQASNIKLGWLTNLEKAQKISKKTGKPILMYFTGSDWCAPCKMLKEDFFYTKEFEENASNFVLVMIDKPRRIDIISEKQMKYNDNLIAKYNKQKTFPKILILNERGRLVDEIDGYNYLHDTTLHFSFINKYIK